MPEIDLVSLSIFSEISTSVELPYEVNSDLFGFFGCGRPEYININGSVQGDSREFFWGNGEFEGFGALSGYGHGEDFHHIILR